jgi:hypothetical protein
MTTDDKNRIRVANLKTSIKTKDQYDQEIKKEHERLVLMAKI